jgi:hypothetical protein
MGTIGQLLPLTDNTDVAAVEQVQQQHHFISMLYRFTLGKLIFSYKKLLVFLLLIKMFPTYFLCT